MSPSDDGSALLPPAYSEAAPEPEMRGPRHSRRGRIRRHPVLLTIGIVAAAFIIFIAAFAMWADAQVHPGKPGAAVVVSIPSGAPTSKIASILSHAGVIHEATLFELYVKVHGGSPLLAGTYTLAKNSSYGSAIAALQAGPKLIVDTLTIPEGYTIHQIAAAVAALPGLHLSAARFLDAASSGEVRSPYEPAGKNNLEGLLFPATYQVSQNDSEIDVLEQMVGAFDTRAEVLDLNHAASAMHMTPYQVVTVASIVEREAKLDQDRGPVASTIYNRLRLGMPLGADSTQTYYLRLRDPGLVPAVAQLNSPSPYNTRLNRGLPPTPISNPGIPSLEAAVAPPHTAYLYFVEINPDGQLGFASTTQGFDQLQQQCRSAGLC